MPPRLNEDALSEHDLLELQASAVVELAAADDLASGLARVVTSIRRFAAAPRIELWSPDDDGMPTLLAASGQGPGRRESMTIEGVGVLVLVGARAEPHLASALAPLGRIVRRRRAEEALSQVTTELARRNEALEDFAALVAHELKTPLHAALVVADDASGLVEQALELVDTLLEAAQTEASSGSVASVEESLALAVSDVAAADLDVTAEVDAPVSLPAESLRIILRNLLANAAAAGARHVQVSSFRSRGAYRLDVDDDGVGLTGIGSYSAGSGIGLGLSRRIAARFGGTLELSPRPFEGTRASLVFAEAPR